MSSFLPLLLLCLTLTMHACKARHFNEAEKERSVVKASTELVEMMTSGMKLKKASSIITQRPRHSRVLKRKVKKKKKTGKVAAVSSVVQSLVSVSWHVSHNKQKGHPGFNLDYSPPKIHPPSHN